MRVFCWTMLLFTALLVIHPVSISADEIHLKNGDRITGNIISMENDELVLKTSYAGTITIKWKDVENFSTDGHIDVILGDGTRLKGATAKPHDGKVAFSIKQAHPLTFEPDQVKAINPKPPEPSVKLSGRVNVGINVSKGNSDAETYHTDGEFVASTVKNRFTAGIEYDLKKDDDKTTEDKSRAYTKYDHFLDDKWYFLLNLSLDQDKVADLNLKTTAGAGIGYRFFETPITNLSLEAGPSYVNKDYETAEDESFMAARWALNFDRYFLDKTIQFFHFHEGLIGLEDSEEVSVLSRTGLRVPVYKQFKATLQYNFDWDNAPSPGKERVDEKYLLTIGYFF